MAFHQNVTRSFGICPFAPVGKILNLLPDEAVDPTTRMVLVNALYFKGVWEHQLLVQTATEKSFKINKVGAC